MDNNNNIDWLRFYPEIYDNLSGSYHRDRFGDKQGKYDYTETIRLIFEVFNELELDFRTLKVLDVGSGTGKVSLPIAECGADVTCLDAAMGMLQQCGKFVKEKKVEGNIHLIDASADKIPYAADTFSVIVSSRFLHLFPTSYYPLLIGEMLRVAKPNGYVIIEIKNKYYGFLVNIIRRFQRAHSGQTYSSLLNLSEVKHIQRKLPCAHIVKVESCQLPKAYIFPLESHFTLTLRTLSRTILSPIAGYHFVVIQKLC